MSYVRTIILLNINNNKLHIISILKHNNTYMMTTHIYYNYHMTSIIHANNMIQL